MSSHRHVYVGPYARTPVLDRRPDLDEVAVLGHLSHTVVTDAGDGHALAWLWLPNRGIPAITRDLWPAGAFVATTSPADQQHEIALFAGQMAGPLDAVERACGSLVLSWGAVGWWS